MTAMTKRRCALLMLAGLCGAAGAETSPYYIGVSQYVSHDDNLLGLPNGQAAPAGYSKSDTIYTTSLFGGIDQPIGRQRVYGSLSVRNLRYADNDAYNNVSYAGSVGLDWSTVERLSGSLTAGAYRSLASFATTSSGGFLTQKNLQTSRTVDAKAAIGLVTQYSFEVGAGYLQVRNSLDQQAVRARDYDQDNYSAGLRWRPSSGANLGLTLRHTEGNYPRYAFINGEYRADRFKQNGADLNGTIQPTGASTFDGRIGYAKTSYDLNQQRDFSGVTGTLGWSWQPTGKIRVGTRLSRDTGQDAYALTIVTITGLVPGANDYSRVSNSLRVQVDYDFSAKIAFTTSWQLIRRSIDNTVLVPGQPAAQQSAKDTTNQFALGARWNPLRSVQLGCDVGATRRTANGSQNLTYDLKDNTYSCFGQLTLQ